jgi:uncharacterized membrane protein
MTFAATLFALNNGSVVTGCTEMVIIHCTHVVANEKSIAPYTFFGHFVVAGIAVVSTLALVGVFFRYVFTATFAHDHLHLFFVRSKVKLFVFLAHSQPPTQRY